MARFIQARFQELKEKGEPEEISLSKTVGIMMYQHGLSREKVIEYLEVIATMEQIEIDIANDKITKPQV
jgi:hypothetical protein